MFFPSFNLQPPVDQHYLPGIAFASRPSDTGSPNAMSNIDGFGIGVFSKTSDAYSGAVETKAFKAPGVSEHPAAGA